MEWNHDGSNKFDIMKEAVVSLGTKHEHVLRALEVFTYDEGIAIVMPLFRHGHLGVVAPQLKWAQKKEVIRQVLHGLCYMHTQNQPHRDIKPSNILVSSVHPISVVLADFGLASVANPITVCGTPGYIAPEVCAAKDKKTYAPFKYVFDVYSLGMVVLDMVDLHLDPTPVTNEKLYHEKVGGVIHEKLIQWQDLDRRGALLVADRMLAFDPNLRPSAADCLEMSWLDTWFYLPYGAIPKALRDDECFEIETRPSNNPIQALAVEYLLTKVEGWPNRIEQIALVLSQLRSQKFLNTDESLDARLAGLLADLPTCDLMQDRYTEPLGSRLPNCFASYNQALKQYANRETLKTFLELLLSHPIMVGSRPSASPITLKTASEFGIFGRKGRKEDSLPEATARKTAKGKGRKARSKSTFNSQMEDTQMDSSMQESNRAQESGGIHTRLRSRQNLRSSDKMDIDT